MSSKTRVGRARRRMIRDADDPIRSSASRCLIARETDAGTSTFGSCANRTHPSGCRAAQSSSEVPQYAYAGRSHELHFDYRAPSLNFRARIHSQHHSHTGWDQTRWRSSARLRANEGHPVSRTGRQQLHSDDGDASPPDRLASDLLGMNYSEVPQGAPVAEPVERAVVEVARESPCCRAPCRTRVLRGGRRSSRRSWSSARPRCRPALGARGVRARLPSGS